MNAKTHYTHKELTRRSTAQLIAIYNRLFNDNAWDVWFNPFEHRQDMLLALYEEMVAQDIVARFAAEAQPVARYKTVQINITSDGWIVTWGKHHSEKQTGNKLNEANVRLIRCLKADGETNVSLGEFFNVNPSTISEICNFKKYAWVV